jgi:hypothetical protein
MIDRAIYLAKREWENMRFYLERCGDIGEFDFEDLSNSRWVIRYGYHEGFISDITRMDDRFSQYEYHTPEALKVSTVLASNAAEKLGLREDLSLAFGMGYGLVRTGVLPCGTLEPTQAIFYMMFYPLGMRFDWNLYPLLAQKKLEIVYERFRDWQDNPRLHIEDLTRFQNSAEVWREWDRINEGV